jgi:trimeric autotransporter adhesin
MLKPLRKLRGAGLVWLFGAAAFAQEYSISTVAGGAPPSTPAPAASTAIGTVRRVTTDASGNVYFSSGNAVFKISSGGTLTVVAGNSRPGFSGDGGPATAAQLNAPQGLAVDSQGNLYIADQVNNRVRMVTPQGVISTFAGNGKLGQPRFLGDGGVAIKANLNQPGGVAVDKSGNVYIADTGDHSIREVGANGVINSIAGNGFPGIAGDTLLASEALLALPEDVFVDSSGNIFIADTGNAAIREITASTGIINFIAGACNITSTTNISNTGETCSIGYAGDGGLANAAGLVEPFAVAVDSTGNVYIAEPTDGRIREVSTIKGKVDINTIAGNGTLGFTGDGSAATSAELNRPTGVAVDASGHIYIADSLNNRIRLAQSGGSISTFAGNGGFSYSGDGGAATSAQMNSPHAVAVDNAGNYYIADSGNNVVRKVSASGTITTFAGNGTAGSGGDSGAATSAQLSGPQGVAVDSAGNVYIADTANSRVREVSGGTITTVAGNGTPGYAGDGGAATSAQLYSPVGLAFDPKGSLYIADANNSAIRKVTNGSISTVAGNGLQGYAGDGGPALSAQLNDPQGVAVDAAGNLYITDTLNYRIRMVSPTGNITTVAGNGVAGYSGDGGPASQAQLSYPTGIAVDSAGNVLFADAGASVRKIYVNGPIITIAGNGAVGYAGDGGLATSASLNGPTGIAVDSKGNVYVADSGNNAVRLLQFAATGMQLSAVTNAATNLTGPIAPGEVIVLYGSGLGPATLATYQLANGEVPQSVAGTSVYFNGSTGPVLYASSTQVAAIVPFGLTGTSAQVYVAYQGQTSAPISVPVAAAAPALFTANDSGTGQAAAINLDGTYNNAANPASSGGWVSLYGTGFGQTNPPGEDGAFTLAPPAGVLPLPVLQPVTVTIGGKPAASNYAGGAPGIVQGVMQVNAQIPSGLPAGNAAVVVTFAVPTPCCGTIIQSQAGVTVAVSGN